MYIEHFINLDVSLLHKLVYNGFNVHFSMRTSSINEKYY